MFDNNGDLRTDLFARGGGGIGWKGAFNDVNYLDQGNGHGTGKHGSVKTHGTIIHNRENRNSRSSYKLLNKLKKIYLGVVHI